VAEFFVINVGLSAWNGEVSALSSCKKHHLMVYFSFLFFLFTALYEEMHQ
jgi:hypothetical protein